MENSVDFLVASGIITGLLVVVKGIFPTLKDKHYRLIPAVALALGVMAAFLVSDAGIRDTIVAGILAGMASVGIYSGQKASRGK